MTIYTNIPYTYRIRWSKTNMNYYGVRYSKRCHPSDLFVTYFTSSKYVTEYIKDNGLPNIIEIRQTFTNKNRVNEAREWEYRVLTKLDVVSREDYLNRGNGKGIDPRISSAARKGVAPACKGKSQPDHIKAKKRKPKEIVTCPHCNKTGGISAMMRFHFNNCGKGVSTNTIQKIANTNSSKSTRNIVKKIREVWKGIPDKSLRQLRKTTKMGRGWYQLPEDDLEKLYLQIIGIVTSFFPKKQKVKLPKIKKPRNNEHVLTCPMCSRVGKGPVMKRHHFNNCRFTGLLIRSETLESREP